jgi:arylsulfatase A-like enzyme
MNRCNAVLALGLLALLGLAIAACSSAPGRPNFVLILADDLGWVQTSSLMHPDLPESRSTYIETPNIDRLALAGMRFSSGYAPAPTCTPTRRSIQFGMTPARQRGTEFIGEFDAKPHLSIPQMLKEIDPAYRCAHFGKWGAYMTGVLHKDWPEPAAFGYDEHDGITTNVTGRRGNKDEHVKTFVHEDPKLTFSVSKRAVSFLERMAADRRPFYLQVSYYAPHFRVEVRQQTLEKYMAKAPPARSITPGFAGMIEDLDAGIGSILDAIDRLELAGNTYVFLTSDNGAEPQHGPIRVKSGDRLLANYPLRGSKHLLYEGGIRVPFIVRGPGVAPNSFCHEPVAGYDLWPTLQDLAGGGTDVPAAVDGGSLRPGILDDDCTGRVQRALPALIFHRPKHPSEPQSAIRAGTHKLVVSWRTGRKELFDLSRDVGEKADLSAQMPGKVEELYRTLNSYLASVDAEPGPRYPDAERKRKHL